MYIFCENKMALQVYSDYFAIARAHTKKGQKEEINNPK